MLRQLIKETTFTNSLDPEAARILKEERTLYDQKIARAVKQTGTQESTYQPQLHQHAQAFQTQDPQTTQDDKLDQVLKGMERLNLNMMTATSRLDRLEAPQINAIGSYGSGVRYS